jgi:hypothetical protein
METEENISVVPAVDGCEYQPHKLYGLWDMIAFLADGAFSVVYWLGVCKSHLQEQIAETGSDALLSEGDRGIIWRQLRMLNPICDKVGLSESKSRALDLSVRVVPDGRPVPCVVIVASVEELIRVIQFELGKKQFALIPESKVEFFEQHELFGGGFAHGGSISFDEIG